MEKYLLTLEFGYEKPNLDDSDDYPTNYTTKIITIGVYDDKKSAQENGNAVMEIFEKHFPLNPHWNKKERFTDRKDLIADSCTVQTPFAFFLKITTLEYFDVESTILDVWESARMGNDIKKKWKEQE